MIRRPLKAFMEHFDQMVPALTLAFYSFVYSVAALFRVDSIEEAISPHTSTAMLFSAIIVCNTTMMGLGGYLGINRLISWGALVFFVIWLGTSLIYIQTGAWYYLFTIALTPLLLSIYVSMRTNTWLFHTDQKPLTARRPAASLASSGHTAPNSKE